MRFALYTATIAVALLAFAGSAAQPVKSAAGPETTPDCGRTYTVQAGDTLSSIAEQLDTTVEAILACNPEIADPDLIFVGQVLAIPGTAPGPVEVGTLEPISKEETEELPQSYVPPALEDVPAALVSPGFGVQRLRSDARFWLERMFGDAAEAGHVLGVNSGYRSYQEQADTFQFWVDQLGEEQAELVSARPGHSEHQLGTTADITGPSVNYQVVEEFGEAPEGQWLAENARRYGFALSYPEGGQPVTGYLYEPWHWRFIGRAHAQAWHESGDYLIDYLRGLASDVQGDADCDGEADAADAAVLLREAAGLGAVPCEANGDADCDGKRDPVDALAIVASAAGVSFDQQHPCFEIGDRL